VRACVVVPLAWGATGSVRDQPCRTRTGHRLSTTSNSPSATTRDDGIFQGMKLILLPLTAAAFTLVTSTPASAAQADWPLQPTPEVVRGFELPAKPWLAGHRGVDLAGTPGQPVHAATAGTITYAGPLAGRSVITVSTGPRRTTYEPVVPAVSVGTTVTPGTVIGHLSAAGSHCTPAPCLHWGLVAGRLYLNPLTLVPDRPIRLLPLSTDPPPDAAPAHLSQPAPRASPRPSPHTERLTTSSAPSPRNTRAATIIVGASAALTLVAGLLIRRH
jgi:hypothetical protein